MADGVARIESSRLQQTLCLISWVQTFARPTEIVFFLKTRNLAVLSLNLDGKSFQPDVTQDTLYIFLFITALKQV